MPAPTLEELLASVEVIDHISIDIEDGRRFIWRIYSEGREVAAIAGLAANVPSMIRSTRVLVDAGLGIPEDDSTADPSLN